VLHSCCNALFYLFAQFEFEFSEFKFRLNWICLNQFQKCKTFSFPQLVFSPTSLYLPLFSFPCSPTRAGPKHLPGPAFPGPVQRSLTPLPSTDGWVPPVGPVFPAIPSRDSPPSPGGARAAPAWHTCQGTRAPPYIRRPSSPVSHRSRSAAFARKP